MAMAIIGMQVCRQLGWVCNNHSDYHNQKDADEYNESPDDDTGGVIEEIEETCLSSKEPPAAGDDCAKAMIVQLLNVLHSYSSIIFISLIII